MLILFWQSIIHSIRTVMKIGVNYFNKILKLRRSRETVSQIALALALALALAIVYFVLFYTCVFMKKYSLFETSFEFLSF